MPEITARLSTALAYRYARSPNGGSRCQPVGSVTTTVTANSGAPICNERVL